MILCSRNYSAQGIFEKRFVGFWCTNEDFTRMNIVQHVVDSEARKWTSEDLCCRVGKIPALSQNKNNHTQKFNRSFKV